MVQRKRSRNELQYCSYSVARGGTGRFTNLGRTIALEPSQSATAATNSLVREITRNESGSGRLKVHCPDALAGGIGQGSAGGVLKKC